MSLEDELRQHFKTEQPTIPGEGLGPEAIMRIGQEHRRSGRIRSTAAGFVVVSAAVLAVLALPNLGTDRSVDPVDIVAGPDSSLGPDQGVSTEGPTRTPIETQVVDTGGLTWTISEPTLGWARRVFADSSGFYALSTAPGTTWEDATEANLYRIPDAIYTSPDGIEWTARQLPDGLYATDFGATNGILYLLGTAPATSDPEGPVDVWIDTSTDLGETWNRQTISLNDHEAPEGLGDYVWSNTTTSLAVNGDTALASVSTTFSVDVFRLAPAEYQDGDFDIRQTDVGLEIYDTSSVRKLERACDDAWYHYELDTAPEDRVENFTPEACQALEGGWQSPEDLVYTATWSELGVAGDVGPLSYSDLFISEKGGTPVKVDSPFASDAQTLQLSGSASGFIATAWGPVASAPEGWGSTLWTSSNGRTWDKVAPPAGVFEVFPLGSFDGRLIATAYSQQGSTIVSLENGVWTTVDLTGALGPVPAGSERWIGQGGAGAGGVWLTAQTSLRPEEGTQPTESSYYEGGEVKVDLLFSEDLINWTEIDLTELLGSDAPPRDLWIDQIVVGDSVVYFKVNGYNPETNESYSAAVIGEQ